MAFTYRSRQGEKYYLHAREESRADERVEVVHYFAPELNADEAVDALPAGYSVAEVSGDVRLVRSETAERHQARQETMADPRARREAKRAARRERFETRTRPAKVDWMALSISVGLDPDGGLVTDDDTRRALEEIVGNENVRGAVETSMGLGPGWYLAQRVLRLIRSELATDLAYEAYLSSSGDRATQAVLLVAEIAHPKALPWVEHFLNDPPVALLGMNLLDQLLYREAVDDADAEVQRLLAFAAGHADEAVREQAEFIRRQLADRRAQGASA